ncbi:MAG: A/G-specific adenine glycosylase [bacterium]
MDISKLLRKWYEKERRDLPWREISDPYKIWVSEIILQQTRINQGMEYYHSFIEKFPDVFSLAGADISEVLNIWQGLGYYSRARNMHHAARTIVNNYNGIFPENYESILQLKGVGQYTAGAIASIAFNESVPAIDGNVKRVISRVYEIYDNPDKPSGHRIIYEKVLNILRDDKPGEINQALMDLGSMVCKPKSPLCNQCPLSDICLANLKGIAEKLPVKNRKLKTKNRFFYYCIISCGENLVINHRREKDIWQLMYDFPLIETNEKLEEDILYKSISKKFFNKEEVIITKISPEIIHVLSHQRIHTRFIHLVSKSLKNAAFSEYFIINKYKISDYPVPRLIHRYLEHHRL